MPESENNAVLKSEESDSRVPRLVMLCILDGWGLSDNPVANAVTQGKTPNFDRIWRDCPHTQLKASGADVGLQPGVFGNSEVGHLNIGAGRIVWQDSLIIDQAIADGSFFENETLLALMRHARDNRTRLHLMGLVSDGSVHASENHIFALLEMARREGLRGDDLCLHAFTDGRDTPPRSALGYVSRLLARMISHGVGTIASVIGRYWAMDRDNRWERVQTAYDCLTQGAGHQAPDAIAAIEAAYARGENDEFIAATCVLDAQGNMRPRISDRDAVLFFNYRSDRGRQLASCFVDADFDAHLRETSHQPGAAEAEDVPTVTRFKRLVWPRTQFATMTRYSKDLACPICFEPRPQRDGLGEVVARAGKTQLRIAETEKYPHVTYFFSGGVEETWNGEERVLVPSPKVATYDLQPQMNAPQVTQKVTEAIRSNRFDLIVLNFANPDMVGHTGILEAAIAAVEEVDRDLGEVLRAIDDVGGALLVIADHGNCEQMIDYVTGEPHTAHTTNPVPCILVGRDFRDVKMRPAGRLADVSPTLLSLLGVAQPPAMTGISLLQGGSEQLVSVDMSTHAGDELAPALQKARAALNDARAFYLHAANAGETTGIDFQSWARQAQSEADQLPAMESEETQIAEMQDGTALSPREVKMGALQWERDQIATLIGLRGSANQEQARALFERLEAVAREHEAQLSRE